MAGRAHGVQSFQGALALHSVKLERIPRITQLGGSGDGVCCRQFALDQEGCRWEDFFKSTGPR